LYLDFNRVTCHKLQKLTAKINSASTWTLWTISLVTLWLGKQKQISGKKLIKALESTAILIGWLGFYFSPSGLLTPTRLKAEEQMGRLHILKTKRFQIFSQRGTVSSEASYSPQENLFPVP
jgi:hypothetical protein